DSSRPISLLEVRAPDLLPRQAAPRLVADYGGQLARALGVRGRRGNGSGVGGGADEPVVITGKGARELVDEPDGLLRMRRGERGYHIQSAAARRLPFAEERRTCRGESEHGSQFGLSWPESAVDRGKGATQTQRLPDLLHQ